jgi:DNA-binding NtrC family response regulator
MRVVVVQVVAAAVDVTKFVTASESSKEAFKTATLLKTLTINSLITGEKGVGKSSLAVYILPDAPIIDASDFSNLLSTLESSKEVIITNLENSPNIKTLIDTINLKGIRVVATAKSLFDYEKVDDLFSVKFNIPPLRERLEDVTPLIDIFLKEAFLLFAGRKEFNIKDFKHDLSENAHSLRRQVMINYLLEDIKDVELISIIENYLSNKLGSSSDYRNFLYLYEVPLIKAGINKYKSQLQLADKLGLNRNTLRKKISDNKQYL